MNKRCCLIRLFFSLFIFPVFLFAQNDKSKNGKVYKAKIYCANHLKVKGILYDVSDSTVIISDKISKQGIQVFDTISFNKINKILLIKQGSGGIGFAIGSGGTLALGLLLAAGEHDEESQQTNRLADMVVAILLAPFTGALGAVIGSNSGKSFHINYNYNQFQTVKSQLGERVYLK